MRGGGGVLRRRERGVRRAGGGGRSGGRAETSGASARDELARRDVGDAVRGRRAQALDARERADGVDVHDSNAQGRAGSGRRVRLVGDERDER